MLCFFCEFDWLFFSVGRLLLFVFCVVCFFVYLFVALCYGFYLQFFCEFDWLFFIVSRLLLFVFCWCGWEQPRDGECAGLWPHARLRTRGAQERGPWAREHQRVSSSVRGVCVLPRSAAAADWFICVGFGGVVIGTGIVRSRTAMVVNGHGSWEVQRAAATVGSSVSWGV